MAQYNMAYAYPAAMANGAGPEFGPGSLENPVRFHRATILPKTGFMRFRRHKHRFGTGIDVIWGIRQKKGPRGGHVYVHAIEFDRLLYSPSQAKAWMKGHGYTPIRFEAAQPSVRERREAAVRPAARVANPMPAGAVFHYVASAAAANPEPEPVIGPKTINEAIRLIRQHAPSAAARAYADAAMQAAEEYGMHGLYVQTLYLLSNLGSWKGPLAQETKKFIKAWQKAHQESSHANPAQPALRLPSRVQVTAKHRGVTGLPRGAWVAWSEHQLATHFLGLVSVYGPGMVNNWIKNIERWNSTQNPRLSAKAYRVRMLVQNSPRYTQYLGRPRGSFKRPNPAEIGRLCGVKLKNPSLMLVLANPKRSRKTCPSTGSKTMDLAVRAYKRFHFTGPKSQSKAQVPDGWPSCYVVIGACERFDVQDASGKKVSRSFLHTNPMPKLATTKDMKQVFIFGTKPLGIPAGKALRVDYRVPPHSGRNKWARRWWHPHESHPAVVVDRSGKAVKISGPGLSVTPRGIVG